MSLSSREIQRLPKAPFSLVLRKEYCDCPQRDFHAVHYIEKKGGERLCSCTLNCCNCDVLHRRLCADSDKIPKGGASAYILHLSAHLIEPSEIVPVGGVVEGGGGQRRPRGAEGFLRSVRTVHTSMDMFQGDCTVVYCS